MFGECWFNFTSSSSLNCVGTTTAQAISSNAEEVVEGMKIMQTRCPVFLSRFPGKQQKQSSLKSYQLFFGSEQKFCCDINQIKTMDNSMGLAGGIFQRCPTCSYNLFEQICEYTCSPDQSSFMGSKIIPNPNDETRTSFT